MYGINTHPTIMSDGEVRMLCMILYGIGMVLGLSIGYWLRGQKISKKLRK